MIKTKEILKEKIEELNATEEVLNFFVALGLGEEVRHIISPKDKNPTVTFKAKNRTELNKILSALNPLTMRVYENKSGCTGYKPILATEVLKDHQTELKSKYMLETKTDRYNSEQEFKIVFFIERMPLRSEKYFSIWLDVPLNLFEGKYFKETIKDVFETNNAREYNQRHADIMIDRPIFKGLTTTKFYGGSVKHYAMTEEENNLILELLEVQ